MAFPEAFCNKIQNDKIFSVVSNFNIFYETFSLYYEANNFYFTAFPGQNYDAQVPEIAIFCLTQTMIDNPLRLENIISDM